MNVLKPHLQTTVFTLLAAGKSQREVARITQIDRKTIRGLARHFASEQSNSPGWPPARSIKFPHPGHRAPSKGSVSACEPYRDFIEAQLLRRRNFTAIYQDLVDQFGFAAGYNSVKRFAGAVIEHEPAQFDRLEFAPAEEIQVDYGEGAPTRCPGTDRLSQAALVCVHLALFPAQLSPRGCGNPARKSGPACTSRPGGISAAVAATSSSII